MPIETSIPPKFALSVANLTEIIEHLRTVDPARFAMRYIYQTQDGRYATDMEGCGTAACIAGWAYVLHPELRNRVGVSEWGCPVGHWLGLTASQRGDLLTPIQRPSNAHLEDDDYTLDRALHTLERLKSEYEATGRIVIDWSLPTDAVRPQEDSA